MAKYLAIWNIGYGDEWQEIEADSPEEANMMAYELWQEAYENSADYRAELLTDDLREDYGLD